MTLQEAYARLKGRFGSHKAAAEELGMTQQHYNALRNGRANITPRTEDYILLKAKELASQDIPPPLPDGGAPEARP